MEEIQKRLCLFFGLNEENEIIKQIKKVQTKVLDEKKEINFIFHQVLDPKTFIQFKQLKKPREVNQFTFRYFYGENVINNENITPFLNEVFSVQDDYEWLKKITIDSFKDINILNDVLELNVVDNYTFYNIKNKINELKEVLCNFGLRVETLKINETPEMLLKTKKMIKQMELDSNNDAYIFQKELKEKSELEKKNLMQKQQFNRFQNQIPLSPLIDVSVAMNQARVKGRVFHVEKNESRGGILYLFYIKDDESTLLTSYFLYKDSPRAETINKINTNYEIEVIIEVESEGSQSNTTPKGKIKNFISINELPDLPSNLYKDRIELNFHTKMNAGDSIIGFDELLTFARKEKLKAIGITDRGVVQSYPELVKLNKNNDVKIIYGIEMEMLEDVIPLGLNLIDKKIDDEYYVVFDIETTGLFPNFDEVIEIGAIIMHRGMEISSFQRFVKPTIPLSEETTNLTNITNEMLADKDDEKTVLIEFIEYIKDYTLVAHNAISFDINFLNTRLKKHGLKPLPNMSIDTLLISRAINEGFKSHRLGAVCKKYSIPYHDDIAHRADYDARVLFEVFKKMIVIIEDKFGLTSWINLNEKLQTKSLKQRSFGNNINLYIKHNDATKKMYELVSLAHTDLYYGRTTINKSFVNQVKTNDLLVTNSIHECALFDLLFSNDDTDIIKEMEFYDFITLPSIHAFDHLVASHKITYDALKKSFSKLVSLAYQMNKKVVFSSYVHYLKKNEQKYYDVFVKTDGLEGKKHRFLKEKGLPELHLRTNTEIKEELSYLKNEQWVNDILYRFPDEVLSSINEDIKPIKTGLYPPMIKNVDNLARDYVWNRAYEIYGKDMNPLVKERISYELDKIITHKFTVVYWMSHLLVKKSNEDGFCVGSRGSVGSSIVATLLDITDVNPLPPYYLCPKCKYFCFMNEYDDGYDLPDQECRQCHIPLIKDGHNIPFETFLGFDGDKVPDIDLNFSGEYQPKAHNFIREMFGPLHSFRAGTISTIQGRNAYGLVKKYFERTRPEEVIRESTIQEYAIRIIDVKNTTGQHPGGIIVVPEEYSIFDFSPFNYPANRDVDKWYTTHFAFEFLHDSLLKFDILGHDNPTILKMLKDLTGIDEKNVPMGDQKVIEAFNDISIFGIDGNDILNEVTGCLTIPEFGTEFVRGMVTDAKPSSFADLIRISGLSHGTNVWLNNAQSLIKNMNKKLSDVIACRDDILTYLLNFNVEKKVAFSVMEDVRKGKKIKPEYSKILKEYSIPDWYIESCNKIKYMFPKAHACAYVMHAYKFMWYKIYYPLEYYSVILSIKANYFDLNVINKGKNHIIETCKVIRGKRNRKDVKVSVKENDQYTVYEIVLEILSRGIKISNIILSKSEASTFIYDLETNTIIPPFTSIEGLGLNTANSVVEARKTKMFTTIEDLTTRTKLTKTDIKNLRELNILEGLPDSEQLTLF
ncbi:PolC-type DNA polymerase III [Ureaplasma canigenitalium]|uniref:PolC-type DNA polymerase III n=1 Tax=Ureaplasma canigenitalium TaxID=42092 RepID=UPI00068EBDCC|nr:PolC-type DNA polymerase III [Ureaplasma canigenitalium]